jgi:diguanylate cyclase (GGDEF)-like protein
MLLTSANIRKVASVPSPHRPGLRWLAIELISGALFLIFLLDKDTGTAPVQHLYYLPIVYAAVVFEASGGVVAACAAIALYHLANHSRPGTPYGELDVIQVILFLAVAIVTAKLTANSRRLQMLATTDDLTGLHNLRSFEEELSGMIAGARDANAPLAMLALDVDRLKLINDAHGHLAGAYAVRTVGEVVAGNLPVDAVACRYGGDEFVIAVPNYTLAAARQLGHDLCKAVYETEPVLGGRRMPANTLSISIGVAASCGWAVGDEVTGDGIADFFAGDGFPGPCSRAADDCAAEELFRAADEALYHAKASGRNRASAAHTFRPLPHSSTAAT